MHYSWEVVFVELPLKHCLILLYSNNPLETLKQISDERIIEKYYWLISLWSLQWYEEESSLPFVIKHITMKKKKKILMKSQEMYNFKVTFPWYLDKVKQKYISSIIMIVSGGQIRYEWTYIQANQTSHKHLRQKLFRHYLAFIFPYLKHSKHQNILL